MTMPMLLMARWRWCGDGNDVAANGVAMAMPLLPMAIVMTMPMPLLPSLQTAR